MRDLGIPDPAIDQAADPALRERLVEVREWVIEAWHEAQTARETGPNPRKREWQMNWDAYWGRVDGSGKADWQANERLPTVADYVERFVAAMREALTAAGGEFYRFEDALGRSGQLESLVKRIMDAALAHCSSNVTGQHVAFPAVFANAVKAGCMSRIALAVTWREGRLRIDNVDAREIYHDPTGQGLYRLRRQHVDLHRLHRLKAILGPDGQPLYDGAAIDRLVGGIGADQEVVVEKERMSGHGQQTDSTRRRPVEILEFLGTILARDGSLIAENQLVVLANMTEVIRGPAPNPFWHGMDWIVCSPLLQVPFSVDGRSYVEAFAQLTSLFQEFTNLVLDTVRLQGIPSYQIWPELLETPAQAKELFPGKMFLADPDTPPGVDFVKKIETGNVPPQLFAVWESIQQLLRESASQNELRLGRLADKSNITATEIDAATSGSNTLVQHIAEDLETNIVAPAITLAWYTLLQHLDLSSDRELIGEIGPDATQMIVAQREDLRKQSFRLRASGISGMLRLASERRAILQLLEVLGRSDLLAQQFLADYSLARLIDQLLRTLRLDIEQLRKTPQERSAELGQAGAPGIPAANVGVPSDAQPQLPVNLARASALRTARGTPPGTDPTAGLPRGAGGRSGTGPTPSGR